MIVHVTRHAVAQARSRRMYQDGDVEELIANDVRGALAGARQSDRKPKAFRLWRERKKGELPAGQRCVWTHDGRRAFIVVLEGETWVVITSLSRASSLHVERDSALPSEHPLPIGAETEAA